MTQVTPCKGTVVVVDDEQDTRELLRELVEARGYRVATAEDGIDALDVLSKVDLSPDFADSRAAAAALR